MNLIENTEAMNCTQEGVDLDVLNKFMDMISEACDCDAAILVVVCNENIECRNTLKIDYYEFYDGKVRIIGNDGCELLFNVKCGKFEYDNTYEETTFTLLHNGTKVIISF